MADADLRPIPYLGTSLVTAEPVKTGTVRQFRRAAGRSPVGCRAGSAGGHRLVPSAVAALVELAGHAGEADLGCIWSPPSTISSQSSLLIRQQGDDAAIISLDHHVYPGTGGYSSG
jgi:hypothetical protein